MLDRFLDMPRTEAARLAAWGVDVGEGVQATDTRPFSASPPSNRSAGSGDDTSGYSGAGGKDTDESGSERVDKTGSKPSKSDQVGIAYGLGHHSVAPNHDDDEAGSTGADAADSPENDESLSPRHKSHKTMFRKAMNIKMPSMRKLMNIKDDEELSTPATPSATTPRGKSRPTSLSREGSEKPPKGSGVEGEDHEEGHKKGNIFSRSLQKISTSFRKGKHGDENTFAADECNNGSDYNSETFKRVCTLVAGVDAPAADNERSSSASVVSGAAAKLAKEVDPDNNSNRSSVDTASITSGYTSRSAAGTDYGAASLVPTKKYNK
jgi:hypothetical protein